MRILIDYRPALVTRTGVGEYVHHLAEALVRVSAGRDEITLFASSWKERLTRHAVPGTRVADSRLPSRALTALWHRRGWPPIEWLAGGRELLLVCGTVVGRPGLVQRRVL